MLADLLHKIKEFEVEDDHPYHPRPSLSGPQRCIRYLDYYRQGAEKKPFPGRFMVVLEDSSLHELLIKDLIQKSAFVVHSEQMQVNCAFAAGRVLSGSIDGIVTDMLGIDRLLEIKALSHFGFQDVWGGALPLDYITQTCLYARGLHEVIPDIREALLLIKNKNAGQFVELLLIYSYESDSVLVKELVHSTGERKEINQTIPNVVGDAVKKFEEVEAYALQGKLHDRQYEQDHWRCSYCNFGGKCWEGWEAEVESRSENVVLPEEVAMSCRAFKEYQAQEKAAKEAKEEEQGKIKEALKAHDAKSGTAGDYTITNNIQSRAGIDKTKIPPAILASAGTVSTFEVLRISQKNSKRGK